MLILLGVLVVLAWGLACPLARRFNPSESLLATGIVAATLFALLQAGRLA